MDLFAQAAIGGPDRPDVAIGRRRGGGKIVLPLGVSELGDAAEPGDASSFSLFQRWAGRVRRVVLYAAELSQGSSG